MNTYDTVHAATATTNNIDTTTIANVIIITKKISNIIPTVIVYMDRKGMLLK